MPNTIGSTPPSPVDAQLAQKKGTRVTDMPEIKGGKKPPSMAQTVRDAQAWLSDPWRKAAETKSLIQRGVVQLLGGDSVGQRNAAAATHSVEWSLQALKEASRVAGMADALLPPPEKKGQRGAQVASPTATEAAKKLSQIFNHAALSFRDAAASRPLPQFRFRGTAPDERWSLGALNTDLLKSTLMAQVTGTGKYAAEEPAELVHALNLLLLSDHKLTPGAVAFCEEIRDTLGAAAAERGPLQRGELQLKELLQAANSAQSAYVRAKDVIAYANARQADIGARLSAVLQPEEATLLAAIKAAPEDIAQLPESTRGQLRKACHALFGADETRAIYDAITRKRLGAAVDGLKVVMTKLCDSPANIGLAHEATVLTRKIAGIKLDLPKAEVKKAVDELVAHAAGSPRVRECCEAIVEGRLGGNADQVAKACVDLQPIFKPLSELPDADGGEILRTCMAPPLGVLDAIELRALKASPPPVVDPAAALQPLAATWLTKVVASAVPAYEGLLGLTAAVESSSGLLNAALPPTPDDTRRLADALACLAKDGHFLTNPAASKARRDAVKGQVDGLRALLGRSAGSLVRHYENLAVLDKCEDLHKSLKALGALTGDVKNQVDAHLAERLDRQTTDLTAELRQAQQALGQAQTAATTADALRQALVYFDGAMEHERAAQRLCAMLGRDFDADALRKTCLEDARAAQAAQAGAAGLGNLARQAAQDMLALLESRLLPKVLYGQRASPLTQRLDAIAAYLTALRAEVAPGPPRRAPLPEIIDAARTVLHTALGIRIDNGVPIDDRGLRRHVESQLGQMLAAANIALPGPADPPKVSDQSRRDLVRSNIQVQGGHGLVVLNKAATASGPAEDNAPERTGDQVATALHQQLGADARRLWIDSRFMTQELVGVIVGDYLNTHADSPLRHQFGAGAQVRYQGTPTNITVVPGDHSDTITLSFVKTGCQLVTVPADDPKDGNIDLDWTSSHIRYELALRVGHDGSAVTLDKVDFDLRLTERPRTANEAVRMYIDTVAPEPGTPPSTLDRGERDDLRLRSLARLTAALAPQRSVFQSIASLAKAAFIEEAGQLPPGRRLKFLEEARSLLPQRSEPHTELERGLRDAIRQLLTRALPHEANLEALRAEVSERQQLERPGAPTQDTGVSRTFWVDFMRGRYRVETVARSIDCGPYAEGDEPRALAEMRQLADGLHPTRGLEELARIGKYAHQGLWAPLSIPPLTEASPFRLDGVPGLLQGGKAIQSYTIRPQRDGSHLVTANIQWRQDAMRMFLLNPDSDGMTWLSDDSYATGELTIRVNPDGSAQLVELPNVKCHFKAGAAP